MRLAYFWIAEKGRDWIFFSFLFTSPRGRYSLSLRKGCCDFKDRLQAESRPVLHLSSAAGSELCRAPLGSLLRELYFPQTGLLCLPPFCLPAAPSRRNPTARLHVCQAPPPSWVSSLRFWWEFLQKPLAEQATDMVAAVSTGESWSALSRPAGGQICEMTVGSSSWKWGC